MAVASMEQYRIGIYAPSVMKNTNSKKRMLLVSYMGKLNAQVEEDPKKLKLYSYWRSSCSTRVRIALNLKGLSFDYVAVNMAKGEHSTAEYLKLNPLGYVPVLVDGDTVVFDSFAILMYLDDKYPQHPLLPHDLQKKAINYQVANIVSSRIQPLQNQPMVNFVEGKVGLDEKLAWAQYHIGKGFAGQVHTLLLNQLIIVFAFSIIKLNSVNIRYKSI
ncbi:glutathione S-transferase 2-like [Hevea brasiliensis]|uniref:glutathione S-transferase 2-like n=1 Tax=Hevea brasiliensis TaxID=3981 RepID=UPI0025D60425|nr:glutathione S-transferase 2-like [Hevea brasiliensis]